MIRTSPDHADEAAFSDDGVIEPSVGFDFAAVDAAVDAALDGDVPNPCSTLRSSREIVVRVLAWLSHGNPSPAEIGRRVLAFQHLISLEGSQRLLAKRMRVSEGRASTRLKELRKKLQSGSLRNLFNQ